LRFGFFSNTLFPSILTLALVLLVNHPASAAITHTIKKGDTLERIAKKYSVSVNEIKRLNNIKDARKLRIGTVLIIDPAPRTYTVKAGDTITKIAARFKLNPDVLLQINDLADDAILPAGHKLLLERPKAETAASRLKEEDIQIGLEKRLSEDPEMSLSKQLLVIAEMMLNIPYKFGGTTFAGMDCSAYVQKVFKFVNIVLPRSAKEQFKWGQPVGKGDLSEGDLVFFKTYARFPSHVGIYLGDNRFIHASAKTKTVTIDNLSLPYYVKRYIGAKRLIADENSSKIHASSLSPTAAK
jgi:peptidoglycan endopeptidase LytE